jgi:hypothetical protein
LSCSSNLSTCVALHWPPRAVGMPRSCKPAAMARNDVAQAACSSAIVHGACNDRVQPRPFPLLAVGCFMSAAGGS